MILIQNYYKKIKQETKLNRLFKIVEMKLPRNFEEKNCSNKNI